MKHCAKCGEKGFVPNAETIEAMEACRRGEMEEASSVDDMFRRLVAPVPGMIRKPAVLTSHSWRAPETDDELRRRVARRLRPRRVIFEAAFKR